MAAKSFAAWENGELQSDGGDANVDIDVKQSDDGEFPSRGFLCEACLLLDA